MKAELPGVEKKGINVSVRDGVVEMKAERKEVKEDKKKGCYCSELRYGSYYRCFKLPSQVKAEDAKASFKNGVLEMDLCPKLDRSNENYIEKLAEIFSNNDIRSVTVAHMEVPCCFGTFALVQEALRRAGKSLPVHRIVISIKGDVQPQQ